jgi:SOS-response transcriptional repressor LexA
LVKLGNALICEAFRRLIFAANSQWRVMRMPLSDRQAAVLKCIRDFAKRGYAPRYEEIGRVVGLRGTNSVRYQVTMLEKKGYLRQRPLGQHRSIALTEVGLSAPLKTAA